MFAVWHFVPSMLISFVAQLVSAVDRWTSSLVKDAKLHSRASKNCTPPTYFLRNRTGLQIPPLVWNSKFVTVPTKAHHGHQLWDSRIRSVKFYYLVFHFIIKDPSKPAAGVSTLALERRVAHPFFPPECVSVCCDTVERLSHYGPCVQTCHRTPLILHPTMEMRPHLKGIIVTYENMFCCRFTSPPV